MVAEQTSALPFISMDWHDLQLYEAMPEIVL